MRAILTALAFLAVALAGCAGGDSDGFVTPPQDDEGRYVIELGGMAFHPKSAKVPANSTVVFVNTENVMHDVASDSLGFQSPNLQREGDEHEVTVDQVGDHDLRCNPHAGTGMRGTLRVE